MNEKELQDTVQKELFDTLYHTTQEEFKASGKSFGRPMMFSLLFADQDGGIMPMEVMLPLGRFKAKRKDWEAMLPRLAKLVSDDKSTYHVLTWEEERKMYDSLMEKAKERRYQKLLDSIPEDKMGMA